RPTTSRATMSLPWVDTVPCILSTGSTATTLRTITLTILPGLLAWYRPCYMATFSTFTLRVFSRERPSSFLF
ncbi:hypothetical protein GGI13_007149, partial [Coemansia sp. RSA 455]